MDTGNRLTAVRGEGRGGDWMKEGEEIRQRTETQTTVCEGLGWGRGWVEVGKGGEMGDICK